MNLNEIVFRHMLTKNHSVKQNLESGPINRFITIEIGRVQQAEFNVRVPWIDSWIVSN